jgi:hypothetical protein
MGRSVMPYSQVMESERERLKPFRHALSKEDQQAFDRLFDRAKMHTSAGVYMAHSWPMETILLSIILEHGKMIEEILGKLKEKNPQRLPRPPRLMFEPQDFAHHGHPKRQHRRPVHHDQSFSHFSPQ